MKIENPFELNNLSERETADRLQNMQFASNDDPELNVEPVQDPYFQTISTLEDCNGEDS